MELPLGTLNIKDDTFLSVLCIPEKQPISCTGRFQTGLSVVEEIETQVRMEVHEGLQ